MAARGRVVGWSGVGWRYFGRCLLLTERWSELLGAARSRRGSRAGEMWVRAGGAGGAGGAAAPVQEEHWACVCVGGGGGGTLEGCSRERQCWGL